MELLFWHRKIAADADPDAYFAVMPWSLSCVSCARTLKNPNSKTIKHQPNTRLVLFKQSFTAHSTSAI